MRKTFMVFCFVVVAMTLAVQGALAQLTEKKALTLEAARKMVAAAEAAADRQHLRGVIAVCDDGGWPILIVRMDNAAFIASVELAPAKARTAALFKKPSGALEDSINHGRIAAVTARDFIEMQGGLPVVVELSQAHQGVPRLDSSYPREGEEVIDQDTHLFCRFQDHHQISAALIVQ
jgi:glc operon protein GlcG